MENVDIDKSKFLIYYSFQIIFRITRVFFKRIGNKGKIDGTVYDKGSKILYIELSDVLSITSWTIQLRVVKSSVCSKTTRTMKNSKIKINERKTQICHKKIIIISDISLMLSCELLAFTDRGFCLDRKVLFDGLYIE